MAKKGSSKKMMKGMCNMNVFTIVLVLGVLMMLLKDSNMVSSSMHHEDN